MPELPEVETVRRGLLFAMEGARIEKIELFRADLRFPFPERFAERLTGQRIVALSRRAKYLLAETADDMILAAHLGMSGSFRIEEDTAETGMPGVFHHPRGKSAAHDHAIFHLTSADSRTRRVIYNDPRRFGYMELLHRQDMATHPFFRQLGVEPTGNALSAELLAQRLAGRRTPLKAALLDQSIIAGLGNIYVCESLWRARLSPTRAAASLVGADGAPTESLVLLTHHIRETIGDAIAAGGSSLKDYRQADGSLGYFQHSFAVYGREGEACRHAECSGIIRRIVQSGRSTFYCPTCQR